ncbi:ABC transporter substrate-binding protein [Synechococcales cyanobacterium C]|uniref:ABC transporter substrate-binding protein n=1 Tax=Petrachloros mirabilis ULC683 TaxID=2781853 RepID=A0A8K1ZY35_9CYAN|nr:ABC transporter substrate-binding protein [Petrachloros mirabilis]NCJ06131.1 ABC transporter substrate-binding protein [Petrachloros mirabilis ULC683]
MDESQEQVIQILRIDIEQFFQDLESGFCRSLLSSEDKRIICLFLLGNRREAVAEVLPMTSVALGNRLSERIYPRIAELLGTDQSKIANNWTLILNHLLHPDNSYRIDPPQLNSDNFQGSFGRQVFLGSPNPMIVQMQISGTQRYQKGLYYQALQLFIQAWNAEYNLHGRVNPEIAIYINNCLIECRTRLGIQNENIKAYTIAVVVPFHHNQGKIASEILRGVAQIQSQVNLRNFNESSQNLEREFCSRPTIEESDPQPNFFSIFDCNDNFFIPSNIALKVMVVNDPNNVYDPYNQTAERLANTASEYNLIAVIGHYSSEMTRTAIKFYSDHGIPLVNASSTSDQLFQPEDETINFYRLTTHDSVSARNIIDYLAEHFTNLEIQRVAIVYNENSNYSQSYHAALKCSLEHYPDQFQLCSEWGAIGGQFHEIQDYLSSLQQENIDVIFLIPDGGIEPNSLSNTGFISRLNLQNCVIAGPATLYQENILYWMHERSRRHQQEGEGQLIACIPWHWQSTVNGCSSQNPLARRFCQLGDRLWGADNVTWRTATAFDSVLLILRVLENDECADSESLMVKMRRFFKIGGKKVQGVTGQIEFEPETGNRIDPPTEIVTVKTDPEANQSWKWFHLRSMQSL